MDLTRRHFTQGLSAAAGIALFANPLAMLAHATPISNGRFLMGAGNELICYHLADNRVQRIPLGFNTHGVFPHPTDLNRVWAVEKLGTHAADIDLAAGKVTKAFSSPDSAFFYGHAAYQASSDTLFVACMRYDNRAGHLVGYSMQDYEVTSDDYICSGPVHDVQFMPDGTLMAATIEVGWTGGKPLPVDGKSLRSSTEWFLTGSALAFFDPQTRARLRSLPIADGETQALTHMHQLKNGGFIAISAPWDRDGTGAFYCAPTADAPLKRVDCGAALEAKFNYEFLSIAVDETAHVAAVTNPTGAYVVFMDTRTGTFIDAIKQPATNIAFDAPTRRFVTANSGRIVTVSKTGVNSVLVDGLKGDSATNAPLQFSSAHSVII